VIISILSRLQQVILIYFKVFFEHNAVYFTDLEFIEKTISHKIAESTRHLKIQTQEGS